MTLKKLKRFHSKGEIMKNQLNGFSPIVFIPSKNILSPFIENLGNIMPTPDETASKKASANIGSVTIFG
jgi:hypothetical protein